MKTYIKNILTAFVASFALVACEGDEPFFGEEIFNDDTLVPLVMIFDLNEDLENITGNNFWNFTLTPTEDGNSVEIRYDSQDVNIVSHEITVGLDGENLGFSGGRCNFIVTKSNITLRTIEEFPSDIVITKEEVANALGLTIEELNAAGSVVFGGVSRNSQDQVIDLANDDLEDDDLVFEDFLTCERHAYFYEWPL